MPDPVREYFRVDLPDSETAISFSLQVTTAAGTHRGLAALGGSNRAVVFQSMNPAENGQEVAYVSRGAAQLLRNAGVTIGIDSNPVQIEDLPRGLSLVIGEDADVMEYARIQSA